MRTLPSPSPADAPCPGCGGSALVDFFEARDQPVFVGHLHDDPAAARRASRGDIVLAWCPGCGLVHNCAFDPARVDFRPGYEVSLAHSAAFREFVRGVAERLVEHYRLRGATVLEIGCGDGRFLRLLGSLGVGRAIGIDPTVPVEGEEEVEGARVRWIRDRFDPERDGAFEADFVCCLSVFEDIPRPGPFLTALARRLAPRGTPVYFEVFNALRALERGETWSVHYEQCNYFGLESLSDLFARAGFEILDRGPCYGGDQYVYVEARPRARGAEAPAAAFDAHPDESASASVRAPRQLPEALARAAARHQGTIETWTARLAEHERCGRRVVVWGSGGKGIGFVNGVPGAERIPCVVDVNPRRQGRHLPGTGQPIVAPEALVDIRPDVVVLTNPLYEREIRERVEGLGLACAFEVA